MQIWAESGKSALPICNYSQILYQFLTFTQNLKRSQFIRLLQFLEAVLSLKSQVYQQCYFHLFFMKFSLDFFLLKDFLLAFTANGRNKNLSL